MQEIASQRGRFHRFDDVDRDEDELRRVLHSLESENSRLKELVVQLSKTIIRRVVAGK
jgi:hypothetical protein